MPIAPSTPRAAAPTRVHDVHSDEESNDAKCARVESAKKQRLNRISQEYSAQIRAVKIADDVFHTMDGYQIDLRLDDHDMDDEEIASGALPKELWSDNPLGQKPDDPSHEIDLLADQVELVRLCEMKVIEEVHDDDLKDEEQLTTKSVRDWRVKDFICEDGTTTKKWLRRSRLVAREFSFREKRNDTYSLATSTHILNLLPMLYLQKISEMPSCESQMHPKQTVLGTVDIKDACLMVDQVKPMAVTLLSSKYRVRKNLPRQRLAAKAWYMHFHETLSKDFGFEWCVEQPCIARNEHCCIMVHVDDVMFCGDRAYWDVFLKGLKQMYSISHSISHSQLEGVDTEIQFLKRTLRRVPSGLALLPFTSIAKVIHGFETYFGKARPQTIPCDSSIQTEDLSASLNSADAYAFGSVVGTVLYLARDRPDLLFTVKEFSASMSNPTLTAVARLRKLVGYLKTTSGFCMMLDMPVGGQGKLKATEKHWILESYSDSDWSGHQANPRSTSCGLHMLNGSFVYASSRTQRVVSLSSCEAELHSMVSCLCDGIYRKRCIQFVMNCQVENYLLVDSSSARQIALRLGPGKLKDVAGRMLWIQQAVAEGSVQLAQVGTTWNLSDLGTKPLGGN